jgi:hypothetical protein
MESADEVFYRTFAADVRAFLGQLVHADWLADKGEAKDVEVQS